MSLAEVAVFAVAPAFSPVFSYLGAVLAKQIDRQHGTTLSFLAVFAFSLLSLVPTVAYCRFFKTIPAHVNYYLRIFSVLHVLAFIANTSSWTLAVYEDQTLKKQEKLEDIDVLHFCTISYISEAVAAVIAAVISLFSFGVGKLKRA